MSALTHSEVARMIAAAFEEKRRWDVSLMFSDPGEVERWPDLASAAAAALCPTDRPARPTARRVVAGAVLLSVVLPLLLHVRKGRR